MAELPIYWRVPLPLLPKNEILLAGEMYPRLIVALVSYYYVPLFQ
jgi:hypothetical protein